MWMLSFVPDDFLAYIINAILIAGAIGTFFTFFILHKVVRWLPALAPYHLLLQIISVVLLVGGVYFKGGYSVEMSWRNKVNELNQKLDAAEALSKEETIKVEKQIVYRTKIVKEQAQQIVEYVDREIVKYNNVCVLPQEVIDAHNAAALNKPINNTKK